MKIFIIIFCVFILFFQSYTQCSNCTFHEIDPIANTFNCDLPTNPTDTCLVAIDTCFSGAISSAFFNTPIVDDPSDAQYFIVPPNMIVHGVEWCVEDQVIATSGTIQIGSYTTSFTGMGNGDMICVTNNFSTPLYPGVHSFTISAGLQGLNFLNWKINFKLSSCASMVSLTIQESGTVVTESADWIKSSQILTAGAIIDYDAVDSIVLKPNFHAQLGSRFHTFIDGCGGL